MKSIVRITLPNMAAVLTKYLLNFVSQYKITFYTSVALGVIRLAIAFQWNVK